VVLTETIAVAFGVAYIVLAVYRRRACWIPGGIGSALYIAVFLEAGLPLQGALQVIYLPLAVYGWITWRPASEAQVRPVSWRMSRHLLIVACVGAASAVSTPLLARYDASVAPLMESLGTWGSVAATWLIARRCLQGWLWWIVVDVGLAGLFLSQGLVPTAALYLAFALLAAAGWRSWREESAVS
jgi:nicotinamide mononucleotide transporter